MNALAELQARVARRVLDEEERARSSIVVALSGAHAYGFPSPDSDLDLKGLHVDPTRALVGFSPAPSSAERMEVTEGVEIDYSSNEIGPALVGILAGNGNYLERVLGALILRSSPEHESLRPLVARSLSRRLHRHYRGFAAGMLREAQAGEATTAKRVLYVLRTALTGTHALLTGRVVADVTLLLDEHGYGEALRLIEAKRAGERAVLADDERRFWLGALGRAFDGLDEARGRSPLPEEPPNRDELEAWLVALRRSRW